MATIDDINAHVAAGSAKAREVTSGIAGASTATR
jgi:hypothetical protein